MSENSSARTWVIEPDSAESISGNRSVMPPGWMPVPCSVDAGRRGTTASKSLALGRSADRTSRAASTTFLPDSRIAGHDVGSARSGL